MRSNREFIHDKIVSVFRWPYNICQRRLSWKTGAITGLLYGLFALIYFLVCFSILQGPPVLPGQPICDGCTNWVLGFLLLGFFVFFPVTIPDFITIELLSFITHAEMLTYLALALLPVFGMIIGGVIGYLFRKRFGVT
jgi:hypothetical protein